MSGQARIPSGPHSHRSTISADRLAQILFQTAAFTFRKKLCRDPVLEDMLQVIVLFHRADDPLILDMPYDDPRAGEWYYLTHHGLL
jgi:hypothetical protein